MQVYSRTYNLICISGFLIAIFIGSDADVVFSLLSHGSLYKQFYAGMFIRKNTKINIQTWKIVECLQKRIQHFSEINIGKSQHATICSIFMFYINYFHCRLACKIYNQLMYHLTKQEYFSHTNIYAHSYHTIIAQKMMGRMKHYYRNGLVIYWISIAHLFALKTSFPQVNWRCKDA